MKINFERIKYSPFGKDITETLRYYLILDLCTVPAALVISLVFFLIPGLWLLGILFFAVFAGVPIYLAVVAIRNTLVEARLLSSMTDEEHNKLLWEYKKFAEHNSIRCGHLTSYGLILGTKILPWNSIQKITFIPGEYKLIKTRHGTERVYHTAQIKVAALFDQKQIISQYPLGNEPYDLSEEIASFIESIPQYAEHSFEIDNEYYFAK